ncbi:MAG TPA: hypothetical protein VKV73_04485 [Chloroflexota bacterium]|nr:hypothetical protein [Chloroflexota bacterium]
MSTAIASPARASSVPANSVSAAGLINLSGLSLVLAGVLIAFFPILHPNHDAAGFVNPIWVPVHWIPAIGMILAQFGLIGLLARQVERGGRLSVIGFAAAFVGSALLLTGTDVEAFVLPFLGLNQPLPVHGPPPGQLMAWTLSGLVFTVGYALQGVAVIRAQVLPRAAGGLLTVGGIIFGIAAAAPGMLPPVLFLGALLFGMALAWIGYMLWSEPSR